MKVLIAGGHGQIALELTMLLAGRGDEVVSLIRNADHAGDVRRAGGEPAVADLEESSDVELDQAAAGCDAVVFAAGAGAGSGAERKETMDYRGAIRLLESARREEVGRYVMVSAVSADPQAPGDDVFAVYLRAKGRADRELAESGLGFTIVRPVSLTNEDGDGLVSVAPTDPLGGAAPADAVESGEIPRKDVAAVLAAVLHHDGLSGVTFNLSSGGTPVSAALDSLA